MDLTHINTTKYTSKQPSKIRSERDELVQRFADRKAIYHKDRKTGELRLATAGEIAIRLSLARIKTADLHELYRQCDEARSFGALFNYKVKTKAI